MQFTILSQKGVIYEEMSWFMYIRVKIKNFRILEIISILTLNVILSGCTCIFLKSI